jgi:competence protein ComFC
LKFHGRFAVLDDIANELYDEFVAEFSEKAIFENFQDVMLVPIPITTKKLRKRGYNQSVLIADKLKEKSAGTLTVARVLEKIIDTPPQSHIKNRARRLENIKGCFHIKKDTDIRGKNIVIIDDITTTFATLKEARKVLRHAGARKVYAFTIAH